MASTADGSAIAKPSGHVTSLIARPSTSARPGNVRSNQVRHTRHRDGVSPGSNAAGRTGTFMGRVGATAPGGARQLRAKIIPEYG